MQYSTLLEAQMGEYPDSVVLSDSQMYAALTVARPEWATDTTPEAAIEQARAQWARNAFLYRGGDTQGFFYACVKREDGTYRYVGFRYGTEGCEYASAFHGMTYTPKRD